MDYVEALEYIRELGVSGIMPGLARIERLLDELAHPEKDSNVIHVAGTNGKGSVCAYLAAILQAAGYKVGRYISPTLYDYRERIQIGGHWITGTAIAGCMTEIRAVILRMTADGMEAPTAFEAETAMAFLYFQREQCDFVILETGMGGRLDATNVVQRPVLSVITPIGMDHMHFLGNTIEEIAAEKGGIIKMGRPSIVCADNGLAAKVLQSVCGQRQAPYYPVYTDNVVVTRRSLGEGQYFDYKDYHNMRTGMSGTYQPGNAAIAIEAVKVLAGLGAEDFPAGIRRLPSECLNRQIIMQGIESAVWSGRFEVISKKPAVIVDGAHNPDGVRALKDSVCQYLTGRRVILVMGVFADKDYGQMLEIISEISDTLIAFRPEQARGLDAAKLAEEASSCFRYTEAADSQEQAIRRALALCGQEDVILSFGSLSTVAELGRIMGRIADEKD